MQEATTLKMEYAQNRPRTLVSFPANRLAIVGFVVVGSSASCHVNVVLSELVHTTESIILVMSNASGCTVC